MTIVLSILVGLGLFFIIGIAARAALRMAAPARHKPMFRDMPLTASFGLAVIFIYVLVATLAPAIAPYGEGEVLGAQYLPWAAPHYLGTDKLGRDMLTRLIYGARNTVGIAFATTALAFIVGSVLGIWAALVGGRLDQWVSRFVDALMAIPALIFSLLLLTIFGTSVLTLILVIAAVDATRVYRLARSVAQGIVVMDYIEAARLRGEGMWRLIRGVSPWKNRCF
jgi:peptide/nickel transport system permease protein